MNTVKVELIELTLDKDKDEARGIVKVNDKEKRVSVFRSWDRVNDTEDHVYVEGLTEDTLADLGIKLDAQEVEKKFKNLIDTRDKKKKEERKEKLKKIYKESRLHEVKKLLKKEGIEVKFNSSLTAFVEQDTNFPREELTLSFEEKYKNNDIRFSIEDRKIYRGSYSFRRAVGRKFVIQDREDYSNKDVFRKNPEPTARKFKELLENKRSEIDATIEGRKEAAAAFADVKKIYGDDVQRDSIYRRGWKSGSGYTIDCYKVEKSKKDSYSSNSVKFTMNSDGTADIEALDLHLNKEQLETVLNWIRKSKIS